MEFNNVNRLLEKYWAGESSLKEEELLKNYFQQEPIAREHLQFAPLFQSFMAEKETALSSDFDQKLLQHLEQMEKPSKRYRLLPFATGIAAAIALLFSLWFLFQKPADPLIAKASQEEIEEAKAAYRQTKAALLLLSRKMNQGTQAAVNGLHELDKATKVVRGK